MVLDIRKEYVIDSGASNLAHEEAEKLAVRTIYEFIYQDVKPLLNEVQAAIYASDGQKAIHVINEMRQRMSYPEFFSD